MRPIKYFLIYSFCPVPTFEFAVEKTIPRENNPQSIPISNPEMIMANGIMPPICGTTKVKAIQIAPDIKTINFKIQPSLFFNTPRKTFKHIRSPYTVIDNALNDAESVLRHD